jgi:four helix bundle protein
MNKPTSNTSYLPHHKLVAYQVATQLLQAVLQADLRDRKLRDQAQRSAISVCCNIAEGAGRLSKGEKSRAFSIARGEVVEAVACMEIAAMTRQADAELAARCVALGGRLVALLTGLAR